MSTLEGITSAGEREDMRPRKADSSCTFVASKTNNIVRWVGNHLRLDRVHMYVQHMVAGVGNKRRHLLLTMP